MANMGSWSCVAESPNKRAERNRKFQQPKTMHPACPNCGKDRFQLRMLKDEGVAAVRCTVCERYFLLLDSGDYWFDVIQQGYPRLARCTCKAETFRLILDYRLRDD